MRTGLLCVGAASGTLHLQDGRALHGNLSTSCALLQSEQRLRDVEMGIQDHRLVGQGLVTALQAQTERVSRQRGKLDALVGKPLRWHASDVSQSLKRSLE